MHWTLAQLHTEDWVSTVFFERNRLKFQSSPYNYDIYHTGMQEHQ